MEGLLRPTLNLGNSIIGVGLLVTPYCMKECGVLLGLLLLIVSAIFSIWSLKMLIKSAHTARKATYEQLAFHAFGRYGKLVIEISIIGLTLGCLVSFFVVIGDLAPPIVAQALNLQWSLSYLRVVLMIFLCITVALPLSLLRKVDSLSAVAFSSLAFYSLLLLQLVVLSLPNLFSLEVWKSVVLWRWEGIARCLPIYALSLTCQPQMFVIYTQMSDPSVRKMSTVIDGAVGMVATGYTIMSFFGYITFCQDGVKGDILSNFPHNPLSQLTRFGFSLSVVLSFPLVIFPIRTSIYSLLFSRSSSSSELHSSEPIPPQAFNTITVLLLLSTLSIAILFPHVENVIALNGATMGSLICFIFPSVFFLTVNGTHTTFSSRAKFLLLLGLVVSFMGTSVILSKASNNDSARPHPLSPLPAPIQPGRPLAPDNIHTGLDIVLPANPELPVGPDVQVPEGPEILAHPDSPVVAGPEEQLMRPHIPAVNVEGGMGVGNEEEEKERREEEEVEREGEMHSVDQEREGEEKEGREDGGYVEKEDEAKEAGQELLADNQLILQNMEDLSKRVMAVEEENRELKDALEKAVEDDPLGVGVAPEALEVKGHELAPEDLLVAGGEDEGERRTGGTEEERWREDREEERWKGERINIEEEEKREDMDKRDVPELSEEEEEVILMKKEEEILMRQEEEELLREKEEEGVVRGEVGVVRGEVGVVRGEVVDDSVAHSDLHNGRELKQL